MGDWKKWPPAYVIMSKLEAALPSSHLRKYVELNILIGLFLASFYASSQFYPCQVKIVRNGHDWLQAARTAVIIINNCCNETSNS